MIIFFHHNDLRHKKKFKSPVTLEKIYRVACEAFDLKTVKFVLFYLDSDLENIMIIDNEDFEEFIKSFSKSKKSLFVKSVQNGLFIVQNTEIIKKMYTHELKTKYQSMINDELMTRETVRIYDELKPYFTDVNLIREIIKSAKNSFEMDSIENGLSIGSKLSNIEFNFPMLDSLSRNNTPSQSSISFQEASVHSFLTDCNKDDLRDLGIGDKIAKRPRKLSEIQEGSYSNESQNNSELMQNDQEMNGFSGEDKFVWNEIEIRAQNGSKSRISDGFKYNPDEIEEIKNTHASEIQTKQDRRKKQKSPIFSQIKSFCSKLKNSFLGN